MYTNDFKDMPDADAAVVLKAQREVLVQGIGRQMFCPITKKMLDRKSTVLVIPAQGPPVLMDASVWDEQHADAAAAMTERNISFEVYDGRELWS